jgi:serine/threonine protein kinase
VLDPVEFLQPNRRLFIDTNIFMDTDPRRAGGLKRLFERGQEAILRNSNPIVVPTKVVGELTKQSRLDPSGETEARAEAIKKAGAALTFLDSASRVGLIRTDLGDDTNPYADDLFLRLFERFAGAYEMCLLTHDITIKLRVRLLARGLSKRFLVGVLTNDGDLEVESDQALFERGLRKYARHAAHIADGSGNSKDESEVATLRPLLDDYKKVFGVTEAAVKHDSRTSNAPTPVRVPVAQGATKAFSETSKIRPRDELLTFRSLPTEGDQVSWESATKSGTLQLGTLVGDGGEGSVYDGGRDGVVKVFDKDHITRHRKDKIELLVSSGINAKGLCVPSALVRNDSGEFVGYVMPRASGREFQRTIFNKRKFQREFPTWKKADLVDICISFLEKVQLLHSMNIILGDINPKNLMIDEKKNVYIIDADSWQLEGYPCPVGTPMFTSPRMLGTTYSDDLRTMEDELFAVATMLFMIVMTGQFPYVRTGTDGDMVQLIREGNFAFQYENRNNKDQPDGDWKFMWSHIHKPVKDLFWHTFHKEGSRYTNRPTATEWLAAFKDYKSYLGNKRTNFDPMSNDVYPIRPKAFKPDTPIQDCPSCGRKDAIAGIWHDDEEDYYVPPQCIKCRGTQPSQPKIVRPASARSTVPATYACKDCQGLFPKSQLTYGRCPGCAKKADSLDPSRLCRDCGQAFIDFGNIAWYQSQGMSIPKSHQAIKKACPPPQSHQKPSKSTSSKSTTTSSKPAKKKGFWSRLFGG